MHAVNRIEHANDVQKKQIDDAMSVYKKLHGRDVSAEMFFTAPDTQNVSMVDLSNGTSMSATYLGNLPRMLASTAKKAELSSLNIAWEIVGWEKPGR